MAGRSEKSVYLDDKAWTPVIIGEPEFSFSFWGSGRPQPLTTSYGEVSFLLHADFGNLGWLKLVTNGSRATLWLGDDGDAFAAYRRIWTGVVGPLTQSDARTASISLLGSEAELTRDLLTRTYAGTGGVEGNSGMRGRLKPFRLGFCTNVAPVLIDATRQIYQVDGYGACPIVAVYSNALDLGTAAATATTYEGLLALTLAGGTWAACPALGLFRLASDPGNAKITADVGSAVTAGSVINTLLTKAGIIGARIDASVFNADRLYCDYTTDRTQVGDKVREAAFAAGYYVFPDAMGVYHAGAYSGSKATIALSADRDRLPMVRPDTIVKQPEAVPAWKVRVGHTRVFAVHGENEISSALYSLSNDVQSLRLAATIAAARASQAQSAATLGLTRYATITAGNVLDTVEKGQLITDVQAFAAELDGLLSDGQGVGIVTQTASYEYANKLLTAYLASLSPAWSNTTVNTPIAAADFMQAIQTYYLARQDLLNALANRAAERASLATPPLPTDQSGLNPPSGNVGGLPVTEVIDKIEDAATFATTFPAIRDEIDTAVSAANAMASNAMIDIANEVSRAQGAEGTLSTRITTSQGSADTALSQISTETTNRANADAALSNRISTTESQLNNTAGSALKSFVTDTATTLTNNTNAVANRVSTTEAQLNNTAGSGLKSFVTDTATTLANATTTVANRVTTVESQFAGTAGSAILTRIQTAETTSADAVSAVAGRTTTLETNVGSLSGRVTTSEGAIANLNGRTSAYWQVQAVAGGRAQLAVWADSVSGGGVDIVGDVRIDGDLLATGTVTGSQISTSGVGTTNIAANAISMATVTYNATEFGSSGPSYAGYYDEWNQWVPPYDASALLTSQSIYFQFAGDLYIWGKIRQGFPYGERWFNCTIRVNGSTIDSTSGQGSKQDGVPLLARYSASAGETVTVELRAEGDLGIAYPALSSKLMTDRRYR